MSEKITIKDIGKKAGVSISTVSRVINKTYPVRKEVAEKVQQTIQELNYTPDLMAKSLKTGKTSTIGLIIPDISNPFFASLVKGAESYLSKKGYTLIICNSNQDMKEETRLINILLSKKIDGLLFTGSANHNKFLQEKVIDMLPVVFMDRAFVKTNGSYVLSDSYNGMLDLLNYMYGANHRSYIYISGNKDTLSAGERTKAFSDFVKEKKIEKYRIYQAQYDYESGYKAIKAMDCGKGYDAVICGNDLIAYGVIEALKNSGVNVPYNISVTGYDDIMFSRMFSPALTTVRQPIYDIGSKSAEKLLKIIENNKKIKNGIVLKNELVIRESTMIRSECNR